MFALVIAGALVGGLAALTIGRPDASTPPGLQAVAHADLENAILSMNSAAAAQAVDEARRCKAPLAYVTLQAAPGATPVTVRIRSGDYLSPSILLSDAPRRVAIPFPAPYLSGKGELSVEGAERLVTVWLNPGRVVGRDPASALIPVVWTPINPC